MIKRIVKSQLTDHLSSNNLLNPYQSAYCKHHSTETTLSYIQEVKKFENITSVEDNRVAGMSLSIVDSSVLWHCWLGHLIRKNRPRYDL